MTTPPFPKILLFVIVLSLSGPRRTAAQENAFQGCEFPPVDWAVHSSGRSGSFWARDAHVAGDHLFVAGDLRSTDPLDVNGAQENNYLVTGPFTKDDPAGLDGITIKASVAFQQGTSADRQYDAEIGMHVIDTKTGEPLDMIHFPSFHMETTYSVGGAVTSSGNTVVSMGGKFTGDVSLPETKVCTPSSDGFVSVGCQISASGTFVTSLEVDLASQNLGAEDVEDSVGAQFGFSAWIIAMEVNLSTTGSWNGMSVKWGIVPWHGSWDSRVHKTSVDSATGDVFAGGDACDGDVGAAEPTECVGWIGRFASADGSVIWRKQFDGYRRMLGVETDTADGLVCFTGIEESPSRTSIGCLSSSDGSTIWIRSYDDPGIATTASGEVKMAKSEDGPFVYAVLSASTGSNSLDQGTPYAACLQPDGVTKIPAYEVAPNKLLVEADCLALGQTYLSVHSPDAIPPEQLPTGVVCENSVTLNSNCVTKFHKYTGQPRWSTPVVQSRGMETSPEGPLITGPHRLSRGTFAGLNLPDTGGNTMFQALLDKDTGTGIYVQGFFDQSENTHSNGAAMDDEGNYYMVSRSLAIGLRVGSEDYSIRFPTTVDNSNTGGHYHLLVVKVLTGAGNPRVTPKCLVCNAQGITSAIRDDSCYVDQVCFEDGNSALDILGDAGLVCDASVSQTGLKELVEGGGNTCNVCGEAGVMTKPDGVFDASSFGFGDVVCSTIDELGKSGSLPDTPGVSCPDLAVILTEACGCEKPAAAPVTTPTAAPGASAPTAPAPIPASDSNSVDDTAIVAGESIAALGGGPSPGAIAGIVIGSLVVLGAVVAVAARQQSSRDIEFDSSSPAIIAHKAAERDMESGAESSDMGTQSADVTV